MKRIVCVLLTLLLSLNFLVVCATGSLSVYFEIHKPLTPSLDYISYKAIDSSSRPQSIYILDFTPGKETLPLVSFGKSLKSHNTVFTMLKNAREDGKNAVAGVNADFYSFYTGVPLSAVISDGYVLSSDAGGNAIGFYPNGEVIVGCPEILFSLSFVPTVESSPEDSQDLPLEDEKSSEENTENSEEIPTDTTLSDEMTTTPSDLPENTEDPLLETESDNNEIPIPSEDILPEETLEDTPADEIPEEPTEIEIEDNTIVFDAYFNKYPTVYAAYLMDSSFYESTTSDFACTEYVLVPSSLARIGDTITLTVESVSKECNTPIPKDRYVLTIPDAINKNGEFDSLVSGSVITLEVIAAEGWQNVETAIGGGDIIALDGKFIPECVDETHERQRNARTAVGVRNDGTVFFAAVDGEGKVGAGMTYESLAEFMISHGAQIVLNLDGGGSTTVAVSFLSEEEIRVVNTPKDGSSRKVSNAMLFVNSSVDDKTLGMAYIDLPSAYLLGGTAIGLEPDFYTAYGRKAELEDEVIIESTYTVSETDARVEEGFYFSSDKTYTERLFGVHKIGDASLESYTVINVVDTIDTLTLNQNALMVKSGDTFEISVKAEKNSLPVIAPLQLFDFFVKSEASEAEESDESEEVHDGTEAIETEKTTDTEATETEKTNVTESGESEALNNSVIGEEVLNDTQSNDNTDASESDDTKTDAYLFENEYITLSKDGIVFVKDAPLFSKFDLTVAYKGVESVLSFYFGRELEILDDFEYSNYRDVFADSGTIMGKDGYRSEKSVSSIDGNLSYKTPIKLDICPESFMIYINEKSLSDLYAVVSCNGKTELLPYGIYKDYSSVSGWVELIAPVPEGISGEIEVLCPIISSKGETFTVDNFTASFGIRRDPFEDIDGIWSHDYIVEIFDMGLINGYVEDDVVIFKPENNITRAEFAKMLASYLALDMSKYTDYGTEFADAESIAEWSSSYIMALSSEGYMNGRSNPDGTLTFDSNDFITREEAMHVFSKLLEISDDMAELDFSDSDTVQEWALESVKKVVSAGIVTGFDDGTIRAGDPVTRAQMCTMFTRLWNIRAANKTLLNEKGRYAAPF